MGNLRGHVAPGLAFCIIGLWHLFNHTKLHAVNPAAYVSHPWFPTAGGRHLELYFIMFAAATSISMELFIMPRRHHPLDTDATIPSNHLHNFEHSNISLSIFAYALFAIVLDRLKPPAAVALTYLLGVVMFAQELLLFSLHSTDHVGLEGQYHWLLQILIFTSLATTVASVRYSGSFVVSYARSLAVMAQGAWLVVIGYMLYTPAVIPKGCVLMEEDGHYEVKCTTEGGAAERAKALANILFSYFVAGMSVVGVVAYLVVYRMYCKCKDGVGEQDDDGEEMKGFLQQKSDKFADLIVD